MLAVLDLDRDSDSVACTAHAAQILEDLVFLNAEEVAQLTRPGICVTDATMHTGIESIIELLDTESTEHC